MTGGTAEQTKRHFFRQPEKSIRFEFDARAFGPSALGRRDNVSAALVTADVSAASARRMRLASSDNRCADNPSLASSGMISRQRGRVKRGSRFEGSSANAMRALRKRRDQPRLRHIEQRTHDRDAGQFAFTRHRGKPRRAAAAREAKEDRLRLIVERMRGEHMACATARGFAREQIVTRATRGILQSGLRFACRSSAASCARRRACGKAAQRLLLRLRIPCAIRGRPSPRSGWDRFSVRRASATRDKEARSNPARRTLRGSERNDRRDRRKKFSSRPG